MSKFVDEENVKTEETKKKTIREVISENREIIAKAGFGTGVLLFYSAVVKKSMKKHDNKIYNLGRWAGRAEFAEELAEKAVSNGLKNN